MPTPRRSMGSHPSTERLLRLPLPAASAWPKLLATVGDFDSVAEGGRPAGGGLTLHMPSQDANDMFKCLAVLKCATVACEGGECASALRPSSLIRAASAELRVECDTDAARCSGTAADDVSEALAAGAGSFDVVVLGGMGGRFDHEAQSLNALVCW